MSNILREKMEKYIPPRDQWTPVDEALYGVNDTYNVEPKQAKKLREDAIRYSFKHHYENNRFYHEYCKKRGVEPDDIKTDEDFDKIPLIPDVFFKGYPDKDFIGWLDKTYTGKLPNISIKKTPSYDDIIEVLEKEKIYLTFSSSTSGRFSFIPRDQITLNRGLFHIINEIKLALQYNNLETLEPFPPKDTCIAAFIPDPSKTYFWGARVTEGMLNYLYKESDKVYMIDKPFTTELIRNVIMGIMVDKKLGGFSPKKMVSNYIKHFKKWEKKGKKLIMAGLMSIMDVVISQMEEEGLKLHFEGGMAFSWGGWKLGESGMMTPKEFGERLEDYLGIPKENCRDGYGMNEMNVYPMECEGNYKHIPYLLQPYVLDEEMNPLPYGEYGRFAFLDPLANSYPGFIVTKDRVRLLEHCPVCSRPGVVLESEIMRMPGAENKGCSAVLGEVVKKMSE